MRLESQPPEPWSDLNMKIRISPLSVAILALALSLSARADTISINTYSNQSYFNIITLPASAYVETHGALYSDGYLYFSNPLGAYYKYSYFMQDGTVSAGTYSFSQQVSGSGYICTIITWTPTLTVSAAGPIKTGITDPKATATFTIGGSASMSSVTLGSSNTARFTITETGRDNTNRTITAQINGVAATPTTSPSGDTVVKGLINGSPSCDGPSILVIVPTTQVHSVGASSYVNSSTSNSITTLVHCIVAITIKDQFSSGLSGIFSGTGKVDERFDNQSTNSTILGLTPSRIALTLPDGVLNSAGVINDEVGYTETGINLSMSPSDQAAWNAGTFHAYLPNGDNGYNVLQAHYHGSTYTKYGDQVLWVWGTQLTNAPQRNMSVSTGHPPTVTTSN